jgi:hypothetical protein
MNEYPPDFNLKSTEKELLDELREIIYETYKNALNNKEEYFIVKLTHHTHGIIKILIDELCNKFKYIGYVTENHDMFPFTIIKMTKRIKSKISKNKFECIFPTDASIFVIALTEEQGLNLTNLDSDQF